jgi:outer membrane autotransporter barrel domain
MGVNADDHRDNTGTRVQGEGDNNLQTRLGLRAFLKGHSTADDTTGRSFQPYVEANWVHNTQRYAVRMDGDSLSQQGARNIGEVKTGIEGQLTAALNVWGGVGVSLGDKGYNDTYGQLGLKYRF